MYNKLLLSVLLIAVLLCGCSLRTAETESILPTVMQAAAPTTAVEPTVPEESSEPSSTMGAEPEAIPIQPGYYLVSSVGQEGNVNFFTSADPANGYLTLKQDQTGVLYFDGIEAVLTWDSETLYWGDEVLSCYCLGYYDPELGRDDYFLAVYRPETQTSIIFRIAEEPAEEVS